MASTRVFAPAKVNLTLHVVGQRADGYHLLDSLVSFAPVGDWLTLDRASDALSLRVTGPEAAGVPEDMGNLALKAAALVAGGRGASLLLEKNLPAASGIGGGSADAAAALRGILTLDGSLPKAPASLADYVDQGLSLGADVPMCLDSSPLRVRGIGDRLDAVTLPRVAAVLVNPRLPVSTPYVFRALSRRDNPPMPEALPPMPDARALIRFVAQMRNDLQEAACHVQPAIKDVLGALSSQEGCGLARMSGSGATCFGLFAEPDGAESAAAVLAQANPGWWIASGMLGDCSDLAWPQPVGS